MLKKWWFWIIVVIMICMIGIGANKNDNKEMLSQIDELIVNGNLDEALLKTEEYIKKNSRKKDGYLKYVEICEKQEEYVKGISKLITGKSAVTSSEKQALEDKEEELRNKEEERKSKEKEQQLQNNNEEEMQENGTEKERFDNCDTILSQLYPYGHTLKMLDWKEVSESMDGITVYTGYVKIENQFGNKATYQIGVTFNADNSVQKINVNNEEVYTR